MSRALSIGLSPCPNDTFAFWAAVHGRVRDGRVRLVAAAIEDIETLNRRAVADEGPHLPVTKLSIPALAASTSRYAVLPSGAALGFGCGPLVVASERTGAPAGLGDLRGHRIAIPGRNTTAHLLLSSFAPREATFVEARFDAIMPMVARGEVDAGLVIHEGRFTYREHGLVALADLGEEWERATGLPLPLGVIAARRDLDGDDRREIASQLRQSVELARRDPSAPRDYVRRHARELDDDVCDRHIALYVNDFTVDLGDCGRAAVDELLRRGRALGLLPAGPSPWPEVA